jgi:hypothetical protein
MLPERKATASSGTWTVASPCHDDVVVSSRSASPPDLRPFAAKKCLLRSAASRPLDLNSKVYRFATVARLPVTYVETIQTTWCLLVGGLPIDMLDDHSYLGYLRGLLMRRA